MAFAYSSSNLPEGAFAHEGAALRGYHNLRLAQGVSPGSNTGNNVVWMDFAAKRMMPTGDALAQAVGHMTRLAVEPLIGELKSFDAVEDGWAGKGSKKPSRQSIAAAKGFLESLGGTALPEISIADDGEISIYWREDDFYVDVSFRAAGRSLYARVGGQTYKQKFDDLTLAMMPFPVVERLATASL
jgi:hypothetical protein